MEPLSDTSNAGNDQPPAGQSSSGATKPPGTSKRLVRLDTRGRVVVVVSSVVVDSPAEAAGIEVGDILVSLDAATPDSREFRERLDGLEAGTPVAIEISRAGRPVAVEVIPAPRPPKPVRVKARPNVAWQWVGPSGEVKVPIVIGGDSPEGAAWKFEGGENGEGYVVVVPSDRVSPASMVPLPLSSQNVR